eukprot:TRINITY_DN4596_c0_g1_i6.p2 TRINITY_DN4596_c0_g1~~TRINITY_DN4596_c0_g1_i6.p2  ORF type:complete len:101 (+),score=24.34 TRINITY_DN4596_c0_g1_i6:97-399(+)
MSGHSESVAVLLKHGARTDINEEKGKTPLDLAKEENKSECVELITQHLQRVRAERSLRAMCVAECARRAPFSLPPLPRHIQEEIRTLQQRTQPSRSCALM